jgi:hypothetical protein
MGAQLSINNGPSIVDELAKPLCSRPGCRIQDGSERGSPEASRVFPNPSGWDSAI